MKKKKKKDARVNARARALGMIKFPARGELLALKRAFARRPRQPGRSPALPW